MRIAVLTGGWSAEREVAFWSAKNVVQALEGEGYDVVTFDVPAELEKFLDERKLFACAVPVLHGKGGEDGMIQGVLEAHGVPYIFSGIAAHAVGMDKSLAKTIVSARGIQTPCAVRLERGHRSSLSFDHPVVVKPIDGGSTIGTSIVREATELEAALDLAFQHGGVVLVEDFISGREFTVPVIEERGKTAALDVIEIVAPGGLFGFEQKYIDGKMAQEICPAQISAELAERLQTAARTAHEAISARHASRSDFIVDDRGGIWFLEINTIPGMTAASLITKAINVSGRTLGGCLKEWIASVRS